ncbi:MAG: co-chaperone GroES [Candidatus Daviesbacteria bacterium]|nr:co-chaperone GroES [Candidatus Daviesbacteria bacterium]
MVKRAKLITNNQDTITKIRPLAGYVLIEGAEAETKTTSGIILPENAQEKPAMGKVLSVGQDLILDSGKTIKSPVEVGDKVYFKKWGSDDIKVDGKELKLVKFDDLMAIVE